MVKMRYMAYTKKYKPLTKWINYLYGRDIRKVKIIPTNQIFPVPSFLDAKSSVDVLRNYCEGLKVPIETQFLLDQFAQQIQAIRLSITKTSPTIDSFFGSKPKPK